MMVATFMGMILELILIQCIFQHGLPTDDLTQVDKTRWESHYKFEIPELHGSDNSEASFGLVTS